MARKPKAPSPEKPPKQTKMTQAEQSAQFIEAARKLGVDESGKEFERSFDKIISAESSSVKQGVTQPRQTERLFSS